MFEVGAEAGGIESVLPALAKAAALKAIAAQKAGTLRRHVAKTRHVESVGTPAVIRFVLVAGKRALGAATHDVVHQVLPSCPLELASPSEKRGVFEFSKMRVDSSAEAHRKMTFP